VALPFHHVVLLLACPDPAVALSWPDVLAGAVIVAFAGPPASHMFTASAMTASCMISYASTQTLVCSEPVGPIIATCSP